MTSPPRWRFLDLALFFLVLAAAGSARAWYLWECVDHGRAAAPLQVQSPLPSGKPRTAEVENLVHNLLTEERWFGGRAPLAAKDEVTAQVAPGYYWLFAGVAAWFETAEQADQVIRWLQAGLGALTAGFYFLFARRAFHSTRVAFLAGLFCALHPFWIINTAELNDGVLATFLLACCLTIGTRASQAGGPMTSLLFGLSLAGLAMVRAALLPFAVAALLWFLLCCRSMPRGWFFALLAVLGFGNGLAPWTVRNFQTFGEPVPIADSAMLHGWIGNNPQAKGGPMNFTQLQAALSPERRQELRKETNQARRYNLLSRDVAKAITADPGAAVTRRLWAGLYFLCGESWIAHGKWSAGDSAKAASASSSYLAEAEGILSIAFLAMVLFGLLGWRWSFPWRRRARLATVAFIWLPLPYLLSHGDILSGQRLPLDGVLMCFAAFALAWYREKPDDNDN